MNSKSKKGLQILGGSLLTLAIVALLSITYANYTATLQITGAGTVKAAKWKIAFDPTVTKTHTGVDSEEVEEGNVTAEGTTISIENVSLKRPGDSITYTFKAKNEGDFDAILSAANINIKCSEESAEDGSRTEDFCKKYIEVSLLDNSNTLLAKIGQNYSKGEGHTLLHKSQTEENFKLKIEYKAADGTDVNGANLPQNDIAINEFGATLTYEQYNA